MAENKRKTISKKLRFEVFKRDNFTCQYCGRMAPDVILEVDHINPVKRGGKNDILNLITSCRDCNRGKGEKELTENQILKQQQEQLKELNEKREQLKLMLKWRAELEQFENEQVEIIEKMLLDATGYGFSDYGRNNMKKTIKQFGISEVIEATKISIRQYNDGTDKGIDKVFAYIPRICAKRKKGNDPWIYKAKYIIGIVRNRFNAYISKDVESMLFMAIKDDESFEIAKDIACQAKSWRHFLDWFNDTFFMGV